MKKIAAILACTMVILGVGCNSTNIAQTTSSSAVSSSSSASASVSSSAGSTTVKDSVSKQVHLQGMTYYVNPSVWQDTSTITSTTYDDSVMYLYQEDTSTMLIVSVATAVKSLTVTQDTTIEEIKAELEKDNDDATITLDKVDGYPAVTVSASGNFDVGSGVTQNFDGANTIILVNGKLYEFTIISASTGGDYMTDFATVVKSASFA